MLLNATLLDALPCGDSFRWTSLAVNCNTVFETHVHPNNLPRSRVFAVGDCLQGGFIYKGISVSVYELLLEFNGTHPHGSADFEGNRVSVVAYTPASFSTASPADRNYLRSLGFKLPNEDPRTLKLKAEYFLDLFAGRSAPLATAMRLLGVPTLSPVDSHPDIGGESQNITVQGFFDFLLRLAWSGIVVLAAASPPCAPYSMLRELPEGPRALRTYENLEPRADFTVKEREEFDLSRLIHTRTVAVLHVVFVMGGHVSWENPPTAVSTAEPFVIDFFTKIAAYLIQVPACQYDRDWYTNWMFGTSFSGFIPLGGVCEHPVGSHQSLRGKRDSRGDFLSKHTATFPENWPMPMLNWQNRCFLESNLVLLLYLFPNFFLVLPGPAQQTTWSSRPARARYKCTVQTGRAAGVQATGLFRRPGPATFFRPCVGPSWIRQCRFACLVVWSHTRRCIQIRRYLMTLKWLGYGKSWHNFLKITSCRTLLKLRRGSLLFWIFWKAYKPLAKSPTLP